MLARLRRQSRRTRLLVAAAAAAPLAGCVDYSTSPGGPGYNTPAVGIAPGSFGFTVLARRWTSDQTYVPDITTPVLAVGLTVSGYRGGSATLTVTDADGAVAFARSLAGNLVQGDAVARGRAPFTVRVTAGDYTGTVALGVRAGGS